LKAVGLSKEIQEPRLEIPNKGDRTLELHAGAWQRKLFTSSGKAVPLADVHRLYRFLSTLLILRLR